MIGAKFICDSFTTNSIDKVKLKSLNNVFSINLETFQFNGYIGENTCTPNSFIYSLAKLIAPCVSIDYPQIWVITFWKQINSLFYSLRIGFLFTRSFFISHFGDASMCVLLRKYL